MPELFLYHILSIYFLYHLLMRSELLSRPRSYLLGVLPWWMTKPVTCAFCFTWWMGWLIVLSTFMSQGVLAVSTVTLLAAPVAVMILDLIVQKLSK